MAAVLIEHLQRLRRSQQHRSTLRPDRRRRCSPGNPLKAKSPFTTFSPTSGSDNTTVAGSNDANSQTIGSDAAGDAPATADQTIREALLGADVHFPFSVRSAEVDQWLSDQIDPEIGAGLSFVGTGDVNEDGVRELIWADPSGQLFISDGAQLIAVQEPIIEIADGIRLRATERFTGLADFQGDGQADWLIEDVATQTV
jgi:hypothetical protein